MPEFWRQNSKHGRLNRVDGPPRKAEVVDSYRQLTPKSSLSSTSVRDYLSELSTHQRKLSRVETQQTLHIIDPLRQCPPSPPPDSVSIDVLVVGAGPAGLMLACNLIRFGINTEIIDNRHARTPTGRADSLQPKTIETLKQMKLADHLLQKGVKVYDVRFWRSTADEPLHRLGREVQFPSSLDCLDSYLLLAHQGFVEDVFLKDIMERGVEIQRDLTFVDYKTQAGKDNPLEVICKVNSSQEKKVLATRYLVGCDGAHSNVRKVMGARPVGTTSDAVWGVIDGELETDFPDLYSKVSICSEEYGSVLLFPREHNMTRLYVELKSELREGTSRESLSQEAVMSRAEEIFEPYTLRWKSVEWFGRYQIGQKVASKFQDEDQKIFIAGDATQTMSPNASQGMNHSMHDSWNLAWKLNLAVRGLAKPSLLATYEIERRKVAQDLTDFDYEYASAFATGNSLVLSENYERNVRFNSGFGADYAPNILNVSQKGSIIGNLRPGSLLPPAKATRCVDSNPVDVQLDIPMLGQFRLFFFVKDMAQTYDFLTVISTHAMSYTTLMGRLTYSTNTSYTLQPPLAAMSDSYTRPERYTPISGLFTFALVLQAKSYEVEVEELPQVWRESKFTVYADDIPEADTRGQGITDKWLGGVGGSEVGIVVVRPDGYVGTAGRFGAKKKNGASAAKWLDDYFDGFLQAAY